MSKKTKELTLSECYREVIADLSQEIGYTRRGNRLRWKAVRFLTCRLLEIKQVWDM